MHAQWMRCWLGDCAGHDQKEKKHIGKEVGQQGHFSMMRSNRWARASHGAWESLHLSGFYCIMRARCEEARVARRWGAGWRAELPGRISRDSVVVEGANGVLATCARGDMLETLGVGAAVSGMVRDAMKPGQGCVCSGPGRPFRLQCGDGEVGYLVD